MNTHRVQRNLSTYPERSAWIKHMISSCFPAMALNIFGCFSDIRNSGRCRLNKENTETVIRCEIK